jgi:PAS domain S-box-containing protein
MTNAPPILDRRWASAGFAAFALALLAQELVSAPDVASPTPALTLLGVLLLSAPLSGALLAPVVRWQRIYALALLGLNAALALAIVAVSGGHASPLWPVLLIPMGAALLVLPAPTGVVAALLLWLGYGVFVVTAPRTALAAAATLWLARGLALALAALLAQRFLGAQQGINRRVRRREAALAHFLGLSNKLRASTRAQAALEEVASAVQAAGDFDCVTVSLVDWTKADAVIAVAIGARGRRLGGLEGVSVPWSSLAPLIERGEAEPVATLPFRSIKHERHLVLPLASQFDEPRGVLTVTAHEANAHALDEARPLLVLLANQAAAALENAALFTTMEQRVEEATAELERGAGELRVARDRAETLYHIARALSVTLDERQVLEQTLALVAQATGAERGGIMLSEPGGERLAFRTTLDRQRAGAVQGLERGQGLAGWVMQHRQLAIVPDTTRDPRWQVRSAYDTRARSVLAVPLLLEREALGVLLLIHTDRDHFTADHAQLALAAASQTAVALSKAQLYRYVSEQSERLAATAQQREEEASKNLAILRSIGDGVVVGDRLGRVRLVNPAAEQILGVSGDIFIGRPLAELPGTPNDEADLDHLRQLDLGERTVRAHSSPVLSARGDWLGSVVVYHDITREVLADKLKSEFVATASHELRTPLTSIRGYVDMLLIGTCGPLNEQQRDFVRIVKNNVGRLVELIDELLDMSRAEAGEVRLRRDQIDLAEVLMEVTQALYGQFREREVTLAIEAQDGLPRITADRQRLRQIMVNLVGNACKYTPSGGHVRVGLRNGGGELRIDVSDTGVGIAPEAQKYIFTPFYRADNPLRDEVGGTGLGLSITRKLVELHGGRIWFESAEGKGSTFSFTLPVREVVALGR